MQNRMSPGLSPAPFFGNLIRKMEFKILRPHRKKYKKKNVDGEVIKVLSSKKISFKD